MHVSAVVQPPPGRSCRKLNVTLLAAPSGLGGVGGASQFGTCCFFLCSFSSSACCQRKEFISTCRSRRAVGSYSESGSLSAQEPTEWALPDLVCFDESDENREEHGGRSAFRALSEVFHSRVVRILSERRDNLVQLKRNRWH